MTDPMSGDRPDALTPAEALARLIESADYYEANAKAVHVWDEGGSTETMVRGIQQYRAALAAAQPAPSGCGVPNCVFASSPHQHGRDGGIYAPMSGDRPDALAADSALYRVWDRIASLRLTGDWTARKRQVLDIIASERASLAAAQPAPSVYTDPARWGERFATGWMHPSECTNEHDEGGNCLDGGGQVCGWREPVDAQPAPSGLHFHDINGSAIWFEGVGGKPVGGPADD